MEAATCDYNHDAPTTQEAIIIARQLKRPAAITHLLKAVVLFHFAYIKGKNEVGKASSSVLFAPANIHQVALQWALGGMAQTELKECCS